jgi:hypothetical protein
MKYLTRKGTAFEGLWKNEKEKIAIGTNSCFAFAQAAKG